MKGQAKNLLNVILRLAPWGPAAFFIVVSFVFDTEFNAGFVMAFSYLFLPTLIAMYFIVKRMNSEGFLWFLTIAYSIYFTAAFWVSILILVNCMLGLQTPLDREIEIVKKYVTSEDIHYFRYKLNDRSVSLRVPHYIYEYKEVGDFHNPNVTIGSLGIVYRTRKQSQTH